MENEKQFDGIVGQSVPMRAMTSSILKVAPHDFTYSSVNNSRILNASPTDIVLEPSAGTGSLAIWLRAIGARVVCNEISPRRRMLLEQILGFETHPVDAEFIHDLLDSQIRPTAVLMNPPLRATGGGVRANRMIYSARHVESARRRLQQGGRLVAIASEAMGFTRPAFSDWYDDYTGWPLGASGSYY